MDRETDQALYTRMADTFSDRGFLRKLAMDRTDASRRFGGADWRSVLAPLTPICRRISCADALAAFRPLLEDLAPEPAEGWLRCAYETAVSLLYPTAESRRSAAQWDGALCFLQFLQVLFAPSGRRCP